MKHNRTSIRPSPAPSVTAFVGKARVLLLFLLFGSATVQNGFAGCDGFGGSGGGCGGTVPPSGVMVIPSTYSDGQPVTSIAPYAFAYNQNLTAVIMPDTITNIGEYAFFDCSGLTNVTMSSGIIRIGLGAFLSCTSLTNAALGTNLVRLEAAAFALTRLPSILLPDSLETIGGLEENTEFIDPFYGCSNLLSIMVSPSNTNFGSLSGVLLNKSLTTLLRCPGGKSGGYTVPGSVTNIGVRAFASCTKLTTVIHPTGVVSIGKLAFSGCSSMSTVGMPANLSQIGTQAFAWSGLTGVTIPFGVKTVSEGAFLSCGNLTAATCNGASVIGPSAFSGCSSLASVQCGTVRDVQASAFNSCESLATVVFPTTLTNIGDYAFGYCNQLKSVTLQPGVINIGVGAFLFCSSLPRMTFPASLQVIGDDAFSNCSSLTNIILANGLCNIGGNAFSFCNTLKSVSIPGSVTNVGDSAFYSCSSLTNATLSTGLQNIGEWVFSFSPLKAVIIPSSLTNIGAWAFLHCDALKSITASSLNPTYASLNGVLFNKSQTRLIQFPVGAAGSYFIPGTVTNIGAYSFASASLLTNVVIPPSVVAIETGAFSETGLTSLIIPDSVVYIGDEAFSFCQNLSSLVIGKGVMVIGNWAFFPCSSLGAIYFFGDTPFATGAFGGGNNTAVYFLPGTDGWGTIFNGAVAAPWSQPAPAILSYGVHFGVQSNQFGFRVSWATNVPVVVEACTDLATDGWTPVTTNSLAPSGWFQFSDPEWTNYPSRIYRIRSQ